MSLTPEQRDRVAGVLAGQAVGDALGVPYEFAPYRIALPVDFAASEDFIAKRLASQAEERPVRPLARDAILGKRWRHGGHTRNHHRHK